MVLDKKWLYITGRWINPDNIISISNDEVEKGKVTKMTITFNFSVMITTGTGYRYSEPYSITIKDPDSIKSIEKSIYGSRQ